ncbi:MULTISPECIES: hypothetical protein [unclassified Thioalkalivibrio]|uniref:hypothetical protein n=1 Tax=unclassified Thioalkalivibrio TaxID=2621013 RepID=UPI0003778F43|nr:MULTISPECIES: hypothetical protein [unclassified Thioalkalivibrio]
MTLSELLQYLDENMDGVFLDGDPASTLEKARAGQHRNPIAAEVLTTLMDGAGADGPDTTLERAEAVKAIGPLRLKYMADDAPVEGFRLVEKTIVTIDAAYNDEALSSRG